MGSPVAGFLSAEEPAQCSPTEARVKGLALESNHCPSSTMVLSFLLYEELPGSYTCLGSFIADLPVGNLEKIALERFKSYLNVQNLRLFTVPEPEIYRVRWLWCLDYP